jgi:hypothetical protein
MKTVGFTSLLFLHEYREASILAGELSKQSEHFRFLQDSRLANLKDSYIIVLT